MVKRLLTALLPLVVWLALEPGCDSDLKAIEKTALHYAEACYERDGDRMEQILHPDLATGVLMPDPRSGKERLGHLRLAEVVRSESGAGTPPDKRRADVSILDVYGNVASVKLQMHGWVDYLHMVKTEGCWLIINVLRESSPEAKDNYAVPKEL